MQMMKLRSARYVAWLMMTILAVPYLVTSVAAAQLGQRMTQTLLLFPLDSHTTDPQLVAKINAALKDKLVGQSGYEVIAFSDKLPAVQRLVAMQPERRTAVAGPFASDSAAVARAVSFGQAMTADLLVVGSVDKYMYSENESRAEVTVSAKILDGRTGKVLQTLEATGRATKPSGVEGVQEANIAMEAISDVARKLARGVVGSSYEEPIQPKPQPLERREEKRSKKSWLPVLLLSLGLGLLLGGSGGGDGGTSTTGTGTDTPPAPPF